MKNDVKRKIRPEDDEAPLARHDAAECVVPSVRHHAGPQALAPLREQSEHHAEHGDQHHAAWTFVTVRDAEYNPREQNSKVCVLCEGGELSLQVSAKNNFFAKT